MAANCMTELHPTSARLESVEKEAVVARDATEKSCQLPKMRWNCKHICSSVAPKVAPTFPRS